MQRSLSGVCNYFVVAFAAPVELCLIIAPLQTYLMLIVAHE